MLETANPLTPLIPDRLAGLGGGEANGAADWPAQARSD